ncbi:MAG: DUF3800 domain-containing protein [Thermoguttaceae bacterium]|nr:DUF3800 domain-containing protein [Thermoguttaceae bacterium]
MDTRLVYIDECGDDGNNMESSKYFILTSTYFPIEDFQILYGTIKEFRKSIKEKYGFPLLLEMHSKAFANGKGEYGERWKLDIRQKIFEDFINLFCKINIKLINVVIDKRVIINKDYPILENALTYSIQRIENDSKRLLPNWKYIIFTDGGRIDSMKKIARKVRAINFIPSNSFGSNNNPVSNLVEDIIEKDSKESYFIQVSDIISYLVSNYVNVFIKNESFTGRAKRFFQDKDRILEYMNMLKDSDKFNTFASSRNTYGLVIYPNN